MCMHMEPIHTKPIASSWIYVNRRKASRPAPVDLVGLQMAVGQSLVCWKANENSRDYPILEKVAPQMY